MSQRKPGRPVPPAVPGWRSSEAAAATSTGPAIRLINYRGTDRRVGVEIEFAALSALQVANLVQARFGGVIRRMEVHRFDVTDTPYGTFVSKLDWSVVHASAKGEPDLLDEILPDAEALWQQVREWLGDIGGLVMPCELVSPPMPIAHLHTLDPLVAALRDAGAEGTDEGLIYAFGLHLNPEIAAKDVGYILSVLRACLLLSDWLRAVIEVDPLRDMLPYVDAFPPDYADAVLRPTYAPDLYRFIDDYLAANPTRNRELDLLPLFAWLDAGTVRGRVEDEHLVSPRPTFHYRLPNASLGDPSWSITMEWQRWLRVERLADDGAVLARLSRDYLTARPGMSAEDWAVHTAQVLEEAWRAG